MSTLSSSSMQSSLSNNSSICKANVWLISEGCSVMLPRANLSKKSTISSRFCVLTPAGFKILIQILISSKPLIVWYFNKQFIRQKAWKSIIAFLLEPSTPKLDTMRHVISSNISLPKSENFSRVSRFTYRLAWAFASFSYSLVISIFVLLLELLATSKIFFYFIWIARSISWISIIDKLLNSLCN